MKTQQSTSLATIFLGSMSQHLLHEIFEAVHALKLESSPTVVCGCAALDVMQTAVNRLSKFF